LPQTTMIVCYLDKRHFLGSSFKLLRVVC